MKKLKSLKKLNLRAKRVLYRPAYDVPLKKVGQRYEVVDDTRLVASLPTLRYLIRQGAKTIILTWCGRPEGKRVAKYRLDPVGKRLSQLLRKPVKKLDDCVGLAVEREIARLKPGSVLLLENVRFHPEEERNQVRFARRLARLGEVWVFDAFAQAHRDVASIVGPPKYLPSVSGFLIEKEIATLDQLMKSPSQPFVAIIGGAKIEDKLLLLKKLLRLADYVLLGGVSANAILQAKGIQVGKSRIEPRLAKAVQRLNLADNRLKIPVDVVAATALSQGAKTTLRPVGRVKRNEFILDIGPDTIKLYQTIISRAGTVLWSGPMGYFEIRKFSRGSGAIARSVASSRGQTIIGGGDTIAAARKAGVLEKIDFVSTGGGAMLDYLAGKKLPGLKYLHE